MILALRLRIAPDNLQKELAKKYADGSLPTSSTTQEFTLLKEPAGWRAFLDWQTKTRVSSLLAEAQELKGQKKLRAALEKFDEVLKLDGELVEASQAADETRQEIATLEEKQAYLDQLLLYDLKSKYYSTYLDKNADVTVCSHYSSALNLLEFSWTPSSAFALLEPATFEIN